MSYFPDFVPSYDGDTTPTPISTIVEGVSVSVAQVNREWQEDGSFIVRKAFLQRTTTTRYIFRSVDEAVVWIEANFPDAPLGYETTITATRFNDAGWFEVVTEATKLTDEEYS